MQADKNIHTFDDLLEILSEHAIGTEVMQKIEKFCERKQAHYRFQQKQLQEAAEYIGYRVIDELMDE